MDGRWKERIRGTGREAGVSGSPFAAAPWTARQARRTPDCHDEAEGSVFLSEVTMEADALSVATK